MGANRPSWQTLTQYERIFWDAGQIVAGVDEVGRGPLAGPVVAAAVVFSGSVEMDGLDDSKRLSERQRRQLMPTILREARAVAAAFVGPREIEQVNIRQASRRAMAKALCRLGVSPHVVLSDALAIGGPWQECALLHGDRRSASIAAASIVAKVLRDQYMQELSEQYPEYGFDGHKGYATAAHQAVLGDQGSCEAHRKTFLNGGRRTD